MEEHPGTALDQCLNLRLPLLGPMRRRAAGEIRTHELAQLALDQGQHAFRRCRRSRDGPQLLPQFAFAQDLPKLGFQTVVQLTDTVAQPCGLAGQGIAGQQRGDAGVAFREHQHQ